MQRPRRRGIFLELHGHLLPPHACSVKSEIISARSASGVSPRAATIVPNCRPSNARAAASIQLLHADARLLRGHTPSAAIGAATQYVSPRPARYTAGPVIALLMNSAVQIDWPTDSEGEPEPRESLSTSPSSSKPIVSMQSVAPNEFRTG